MRTRLPLYYIVKRHYRDTRTPGRIYEGFRTLGDAEERRRELLKNDPNNNYWIFDWDDEAIEQIKNWRM
jgi:hypothetical protein